MICESILSYIALKRFQSDTFPFICKLIILQIHLEYTCFIHTLCSCAISIVAHCHHIAAVALHILKWQLEIPSDFLFQSWLHVQHLKMCFCHYKSTCLWSTWLLDSTHGAQYNRTKLGWFNAVTFEDWFQKIVLQYLKKLPGLKILIGDNLSSRINFSVIKLCEKYNIGFILLPPNAMDCL